MCLGEARVVAGVGEQFGALGGEGGIEHPGEIGEQSVGPAPFAQLFAAAVDLLAPGPQPWGVLPAPLPQITQRLSDTATLQYPFGEGIDGTPGVERRGEWVGSTVVAAVAVTAHLPAW